MTDCDCSEPIFNGIDGDGTCRRCGRNLDLSAARAGLDDDGDPGALDFGDRDHGRMQE